MLLSLSFCLILAINYHIIASHSFQNGIIGFDCAHPDVNITSFSLVDAQSCQLQTDHVESTEVTIQVLQQRQKIPVHVKQCKVIYRREIKYCGMHSHVSDYEGGHTYDVKTFTREECDKLHSTRTLHLTDRRAIESVLLNMTTRGRMLVYGSLEGSTCVGETYITTSRQYSNALVYYDYEISLFDYQTTADIVADSIQMRKGLQCSFSTGTCLDSEEGYFSWNTNEGRNCESTDYEVIYEGVVNKTRAASNNNQVFVPSLYSAYAQDSLFTIRSQGKKSICGYNAYSTDHDRIFIVESSSGKYAFHTKSDSGLNLDLFTYFNSKITFLEHHMGRQLTELYKSMMNEVCKLDKNLLDTHLKMARLNPQEFASSFTKRSGYTAVVAGEVIYLIECKPTYVILDPRSICYQEIPVIVNNQSLFLSPVTHIIQERGVEIECTPLMAPKFKLGGNWVTLDHGLRVTPEPAVITSDVVTSWHYDRLDNLLKAGIYSPDNVEKMKRLIYDQGDKRSVMSIMHRLATNLPVDTQRINFERFIPETSVESVIKKAWQSMWSWTNMLGNLCSSMIGIYLIAKTVKIILDSIAHGKILYDIYGFGWRLMACFWDSLTNLLTHNYHTKLYKHRYDMNDDKVELGNDIELKTTVDKEETAPDATLTTPHKVYTSIYPKIV